MNTELSDTIHDRLWDLVEHYSVEYEELSLREDKLFVLEANWTVIRAQLVEEFGEKAVRDYGMVKDLVNRE